MVKVSEALAQACDAVREALKPFATFADALSESVPDKVALGVFADGAMRFSPTECCVGDLRRARSLVLALSTPTEEPASQPEVIGTTYDGVDVLAPAVPSSNFTREEARSAVAAAMAVPASHQPETSEAVPVALLYEWTDGNGKTRQDVCLNTPQGLVTKVNGQPPRFVGKLYAHPDPEATRSASNRGSA